jgi:hypothetical protein
MNTQRVGKHRGDGTARTALGGQLPPSPRAVIALSALGIIKGVASLLRETLRLLKTSPVRVAEKTKPPRTHIPVP